MHASTLAPTTIPELLAGPVARSSGTPALAAPGSSPIAHGDLAELVRRTGMRLRGAGVARDDVVALVLDNGPEAASAFLSIASAAVCAPLNAAYRETELDFYLGDLGARAVVVGRRTSSPVREVAASRGIEVVELDVEPQAPAGTFDLRGVPAISETSATTWVAARPDDVALVLHTSGTTSRPKLVPLTHRNLCASAENVAAVLGLTGTDRCLNVMPLFHIHGLVAALLASLRVGASVGCTPGFHAVKVFDWARELQPSWMTAVPTMLQAILARVSEDAHARSSLSPLRFVRSSSSALPPSVAEGLERALGIPVVEAYGMTEAAHQMASNPLPPGRRLPGSVGLPAGPEIAILDAVGNVLPAGSVGEVAIRGVNVFGGYVANPEANASSFTGGWFRTGDEGRIDEDGYLHLSGRLKEIINRGGEKIAPAEIDDVLLRHPAVAQAVTFAIPDPRLGEEVGAAVVLKEPGTVDARELQDFASLTIAPFKVPRSIVLVDEIPKGPTGKLQRIGLHERLGVGAGAGEDDHGTETAPVRPRTYAERCLAEIWCDVLGIPAIGDHDDFFALGGDSILGAEMVARVRDMTGRPDVPLVSIVRAPTLSAFAVEIGDVVVRGEGALVPITTVGDRTPFFLVHGADGDVLGFPALARRLRVGRPLYGLQARLAADGRLLDASVEEMASSYLDEVSAVQPDAPYLLGGFCAGAPIAIEMARLLQERGGRVAPLVLIDPRLRPRRDHLYYARRLRARARTGQLRRVAWQRARQRLARTPTPGPVAAAESPTLEQLCAVRDAYVLRPLDVPAVLVTSEDYDELGVPRETWVDALGSVRSLTFAGSHQRLFLPPVVDGLARAVQSALDEVDH